MTKDEKSLLETAISSARSLALNAQYGEEKVFELVRLLELEDVINKDLASPDKPDWLNGDNIQQGISCFLAYGEGDAHSLVELINQNAQKEGKNDEIFSEKVR